MHSLSNTVFVFDLDDTLYSERSYELSGIEAVWHEMLEIHPDLINKMVFNDLVNNRDKWIEMIISHSPQWMKVAPEVLLDIYRKHVPKIELYEDGAQLLSFLTANKAKLAMITDGRSESQRQKLRALKIEQLFNPIRISEETGHEKPDVQSYRDIEDMYPGYNYVYLGDNPKKDFVTPNNLGWYTYGLISRGNNVHSQKIEIVDTTFLPNMWLNTLSELIPKIKMV
jgi:putative hydrolase of the HAD superfamily